MAIKFVEREPERAVPIPADPAPDVPTVECTPLPEAPKPKRRAKAAVLPAETPGTAEDAGPGQEERQDAAPAEPTTAAAPLLPGIPAGSRRRRRSGMMGFG